MSEVSCESTGPSTSSQWKLKVSEPKSSSLLEASNRAEFRGRVTYRAEQRDTVLLSLLKYKYEVDKLNGLSIFVIIHSMGI